MTDTEKATFADIVADALAQDFWRSELVEHSAASDDPLGIELQHYHATFDHAAFAAAILRDPRLADLLAEALHDATPVEQDGGVPDVCNRWVVHHRDASAIIRSLGEKK